MGLYGVWIIGRGAFAGLSFATGFETPSFSHLSVRQGPHVLGQILILEGHTLLYYGILHAWLADVETFQTKTTTAVKYMQTKAGSESNVNAPGLPPSRYGTYKNVREMQRCYGGNSGYMAFMCVTSVINSIRPAHALSPPLRWATAGWLRNRSGQLTFL